MLTGYLNERAPLLLFFLGLRFIGLPLVNNKRFGFKRMRVPQGTRYFLSISLYTFKLVNIVPIGIYKK